MVLPYDPELIDELLPKDFWEPVKITVPVDYFIYESIVGGLDCTLCSEHRMDRTKLKCCKNHVCKVCVRDWFTKESTVCPFCKRDVRGGK